jgi:hypothetical protein
LSRARAATREALNAVLDFCREDARVSVKLDDVILEELRRGPATVSQIAEGISKRVYVALDRLVKAGKVIKHGFPGKGNEKVYSLPDIKRRRGL